MNRIVLSTVAVLVAMVGFAMMGEEQEATAGLFGRKCCCRPACCEPAACHCGHKHKCGGLFARMRARKCRCACAAPSCCAPAPSCCDPCHSHMSCGCEPSCGCESSCGGCGGCGDCGYAAAPCGCEGGAAPAPAPGGGGMPVQAQPPGMTNQAPGMQEQAPAPPAPENPT